MKIVKPNVSEVIDEGDKCYFKCSKLNFILIFPKRYKDFVVDMCKTCDCKSCEYVHIEELAKYLLFEIKMVIPYAKAIELFEGPDGIIRIKVKDFIEYEEKR